MAENPVISKFGAATRAGQAGTPTPGELQSMFDKPAYVKPATRYMTLDDVVVRTGAMLAVLLLAGGASWVLAPDAKAFTPLLLIGAMGGLGLGLYMSFTMKANAVTALLYSAFEGLLLGAISRVFDARWHGIVIQAVTGTVMVAAGMLFVYKIGAIRVTPKFTRIVVGATIGVFGLMVINMLAYLFHPGGLGLRNGGGIAIIFSLMVVNMIAYLFTPGGLGLRSGGAMAIIFSLICIGIAAMNLVMDFDMIERGIRQGADEKFAWFAAFGLMVTLVWLYIELLRLLSYLRNQ
jgi:uncharacterized YccA/Bax inhibitor family protein